jgi:hypothetical protein
MVTGLALASLSVNAQSLTAEDFERWFQENQKAQKNFKDGDLITYDKADLIRAFIPPGYQDEMIFDGMEVVVKDPTDLSPAAIYQEATKKFQSQVKLGTDGAIENYVAGRPFDPDTFVPGDGVSGIKAAWNFNYRWQHEGLKIPHINWVWVRAGGNHDDHEIMHTKYAKYYSGGGKFERILMGPYHRVYFTHRADLADNDYKVKSSWAKDTEFRELTAFNAPFDIDGTAFLILRHENPRKADDSWAYVPNLRRVRRISVEVKSDSLLGTDHTLEDFYCFAGRVLDQNWKYLGTARILAVARSRNDETYFYGPNGWTPKDDWELRKVDVYKQIPKSKTHPYSAKYIMTDYQNNTAYYCNAFDKKGDLWKVWQLSKVWTEDPQFGGKGTPKGTRMSAFQSINVIDKQNGRGTLVPTYGATYPNNKLSLIRRELDVNQLTQGR